MFCEKCKKIKKNKVLLYLCVSNISVFGATTGAPYRVGATKMRSSSEAEAICDVYIYIYIYNISVFLTLRIPRVQHEKSGATTNEFIQSLNYHV